MSKKRQEDNGWYKSKLCRSQFLKHRQTNSYKNTKRECVRVFVCVCLCACVCVIRPALPNFLCMCVCACVCFVRPALPNFLRSRRTFYFYVTNCQRSVSSKALLNLPRSNDMGIAEFGLQPNVSKSNLSPKKWKHI